MLIHRAAWIDESQIKGRDLQVNVSRSSFCLRLGPLGREGWPAEVLEDDWTPGFFLTPSLVFDRLSQHCIGLGDIVLHTRSKFTLDAKENAEAASLQLGMGRMGHCPARRGGGYGKQRKPGPIIMTRGLIKFCNLAFWMEEVCQT